MMQDSVVAPQQLPPIEGAGMISSEMLRTAPPGISFPSLQLLQDPDIVHPPIHGPRWASRKI